MPRAASRLLWIGGVPFPTPPSSLHTVSKDRTSQAQLVYVDTVLELYSQDREERGVELPLL